MVGCGAAAALYWYCGRDAPFGPLAPPRFGRAGAARRFMVPADSRTRGTSDAHCRNRCRAGHAVGLCSPCWPVIGRRDRADAGFRRPGPGKAAQSQRVPADGIPDRNGLRRPSGVRPRHGARRRRGRRQGAGVRTGRTDVSRHAGRPVGAGGVVSREEHANRARGPPDPGARLRSRPRAGPPGCGFLPPRRRLDDPGRADDLASTRASGSCQKRW